MIHKLSYIVYAWFIIICILCEHTTQAAPTEAQVLQDTLLLKNPKGVHISEAYRYYTEPFTAAPNPEQVEAQWRAGKFQPGPWHQPLNLGMLHERVWMRLAVRNTELQRLRYLWSIFNFVDSATLYCRRQGETTFTALGTASSWTPASERAFPARSVSFPFTLEPNESAVLYLRIELYSGALYLPTYIETAEHFLSWEMNFPFERHWVWLLGFYLSSALFNLVLFAFLRDQIHTWYVAYVVCVTLFLMMEDSLDAMLLPAALYKLIWSVGQFNFMLLAAAAGIRIMQLFLRLRSGWRRLYRLGNWLAGVAVVFVGVYATLLPWAVRYSMSVVLILNSIRELLLLSLFAYGWVTLIAVMLSWRRRRLALYYTLTYLFFFTGVAVFWLNHMGLTSFNPIYPNPLAWGLFLELLVLSALLTGRFRYTLRQNAQLRIKQLRQRNALGTRLIAAQEEERERLARELHDALGPNLAALHLAWQGQAVQQAISSSPEAAAAGRHTELLLRHLRDEVRTFSHAVLPAEPGLGGLTESVAALAELLNLYGSPAVRTYCDAGLEQLPQPLQLAAYRIAAELLNNAVRHSHATEVQVQLLRLPAALEIMVEDNGSGFNPTATGPGIGLRGVYARAEYLHGQVHIDSTEKGSCIMVRLPC